MTRHRILPPLVLLLLSPVLAQMSAGNLKVRVTFTDGRACNIQARVQLMGSASNGSMAEGFTNDSGMTEFNNVEVGNYHLVVSGQGIEETDSGIFTVDNRRGSQYVYISVKRTGEAESANRATTETATVSTTDLNIPSKAAKEFDKATRLMAQAQWKKAIAQLNRALAIYPKYVEAYTNLGVAYGRLGDRNSERTALQKAVSLNDHFAPAYVNLARMDIVDHDFPGAETLLEKATALDPTDSHTLVLLANVELLDHHYDLAIANSRKAHALAQTSHSLVHYIAARAFEHESRHQDAAAEFQTFLSEEPSGERADAVRKELASLNVAP